MSFNGIAAAGVSTIGTLAIVGTVAKLGSKVASGNYGGTRTRKSNNYRVLSTPKTRRTPKKKSYSILGL